jgi:hypothetical protein
MAANESSKEESRPAGKQKKSYEKPTFRYEQVFVTSALSCGKLDTQASCFHGSKVS